MKDPELYAHQEWLGYVQPVGLVVSAPALNAAQAHVSRNITSEHRDFLNCLPTDDNDEHIPQLVDFARFTQDVLGWREDDLEPFPKDDLPADLSALEVVLPEYNETLRPTHVIREYAGSSQSSVISSQSSTLTTENRELKTEWLALVQELPPGQPLDEVPEDLDNRKWQATPQDKFERLLRDTEVPIGIITNLDVIRLVYAPRGETSGYMTFNVAEMSTVAGRPIFAALHMLLCEEILFSKEKKLRLPAILANSRKYQNTVSTELAQQVMAALFELLRGFQSAHDDTEGRLLRDVLEENPQHVYHGLLNVLMRLVFVLYAEDRNLLSSEAVYTNHYSVTGLFDRLRADAGRHLDTMDQRYGAWAQLLTLFRMIYEGGSHDEFRIPKREGYLFDPKRYPFLEGVCEVVGRQSSAVSSQVSVPTTENPQLTTAPRVPRVSDGVVYRVLNNLLILEGERLSYRTLDVEQIGSVYEAIMGFELEVAEGRSIAIKPVKKHGAPATINLEALLEAKATDRAKLLKEWTDQKLTGAALKELKAAESIDDLLAALDKKIAKRVTASIVPAGAMVFQPSDERRRSGSHYTPRSLTEPIVRTTLEPVLNQLTGELSGVSPQLSDENAELTTENRQLTTVWQPTAAEKKRYTQGEINERIRLSELKVKAAKQAHKIGVPHPRQILDLKICDPAMGSGAFLVEVCRQLADVLIKSCHAHNELQLLTPDNRELTTDDEVLVARRQVAQRCLYGVDKNDMAVDLAKLSLWLITLAKDHAFTFLDHSLRHGDSLVGLTRQQIIGFHWNPRKQKKFGEDQIQKRLDRASEARAKILNPAKTSLIATRKPVWRMPTKL